VDGAAVCGVAHAEHDGDAQANDGVGEGGHVDDDGAWKKAQTNDSVLHVGSVDDGVSSLN
jgi:hypothetical protein